MGRHKQTPAVVEAWQWDGWELERSGIPDFVHHACLFKPDSYNNDLNRLFAKTRDGNMWIHKGDYIIEDVNGWVYPMKPNRFSATHTAQVSEAGSLNV